MATGASLVSTQNYVESPFIIVQIGNYSFGHCEKSKKDKLRQQFNIRYPNYMESLSVVKVNGSINTYTLNMIYAITETDDPNRLEKVFSSVANTRLITLKYGDWNSPAYIYKEETAVITKLTTKVNLQNSTITYTVNCTSTAVSLTSGTFSFSKRFDKPSNVLRELLDNESYGLTNVFTGMKNASARLNQFIASDDQEVQLEGKVGVTIMEYIGYLVSCMVYIQDDPAATLKSHCYFWAVYDDTSGSYGGTYFKVSRVQANAKTSLTYNTYEIDVGYPSASCVTDFTVNNDDSWALLYDYSGDLQLPQYSYEIQNSGDITPIRNSKITASKNTFVTTEATRNWWSLVTQFPITASITIKGLLRPAMLMTYLKINTYFYGHKHTSSGLYIITKQEDRIDASGYKTTLSLTRVGGDEHYA